jgi:protein TonB
MSTSRAQQSVEPQNGKAALDKTLKVQPPGASLATIVAATIHADEKDSLDFIDVDVMPTIVKRANPVYPKEALEKKLEGMVWIKLKVDKEGKPQVVQVTKTTDDVFRSSAIDAARQFTFTPATKGDKKVEVWVAVPFKYKLAEKHTPESDKQGSTTTNEAHENPEPTDLKDVEVAPTISSTKEPYYPEIAQKSGLEGTVWVRILVDTSGRGKRVEILKSTSEVFNESALAAARAYTFLPALAKGTGRPVEVWVTLPFKYKLAHEPSGKPEKQAPKKKK